MPFQPEIARNPAREPIVAPDLIPHFDRMRVIRNYYAGLEANNYGTSWGLTEKFDGSKGDLGEAAKNELRLRNMYPWNGSPEELKRVVDHEIVDMIWSTLVISDDLQLNAEEICRSAEPLNGTPRQMLNRWTLATGMLDQMVDPPEEPLPLHCNIPEGQDSAAYFATEAFRTLVSLANSYQIDLPDAVTSNMAELERNIPGEYL